MGNKNSTLTKPNQAAQDCSTSVIDCGYTSSLDLYKNQKEDYDKSALKQLIKAKKLAPFYKGLNEKQKNPLNPPLNNLKSINDLDTIKGGDYNKEYKSKKLNVGYNESLQTTENIQPNKNPITINKETKANKLLFLLTCGLLGRTKKQTDSNQHNSKKVDKNLENSGVYDYLIECPICFLYYPQNINYSDCCGEPICTECFLQIKSNNDLETPSLCPYCAHSDYGVRYSREENPLFNNSHKGVMDAKEAKSHKESDLVKADEIRSSEFRFKQILEETNNVRTTFGLDYNERYTRSFINSSNNETTFNHNNRASSSSRRVEAYNVNRAVQIENAMIRRAIQNSLQDSTTTVEQPPNDQ